jgi:hypothetical protein
MQYAASHFGGYNCSTGILSGFSVMQAGEKGIKALMGEIEDFKADANVNMLAVTNSAQDLLAGEALRRCGFVAIYKAPGSHGGYQTFYAFHLRGGGQLAPQLATHPVPDWIVVDAEAPATKGSGLVAATKGAKELLVERDGLAEANAELHEKLADLKRQLKAAVKPPAKVVGKVSRFEAITRKVGRRKV